ncbi:MAG: hypothetical protein WC042_01675 [Candidatus Paceibacterota bacterium]
MINFKKILLIRIFLIIGLIGACGGIFYYIQKDIAKTVTAITLRKKEVFLRGRVLTNVENLEKEKKEALPYLENLKKALPTESETVGFEDVLKTLAAKNGLTLSFRFGVLNKETEGSKKSYNFDLIASGPKKGILNWLKDFQELPYTVLLEKIEIIETGQKELDANYEAKILGKIYLR